MNLYQANHSENGANEILVYSSENRIKNKGSPGPSWDTLFRYPCTKTNVGLQLDLDIGRYEMGGGFSLLIVNEDLN